MSAIRLFSVSIFNKGDDSAARSECQLKNGFPLKAFSLGRFGTAQAG